MRFVIDASVLLAVIADEPEKPRLIKLTEGHELAAPRSVHWEIGNALSAMLKKRRIDIDMALSTLSIYRRIPIGFLDVDLEQSVRLAAKLALYAYDAYIIHCSIQYQLPLISLDRKLVEAAHKAGASIVEVAP